MDELSNDLKVIQEVLRRQRSDLEQDMADQTAKSAGTAELLRKIEELRVRMERTASTTPAENEYGPRAEK